MKIHKYPFVFLFVLLLPCCATQKIKQYQIIKNDNDFIHPVSKMVCPCNLNDFGRVSTKVFDSLGEDISCGYRYLDQADPFTVTTYVYSIRTGSVIGNYKVENRNMPQLTLKNHFENVKKVLQDNYGTTSFKSEEPIEMTQLGHIQNGLKASFELEMNFGHGNQISSSHLILFKYGDWFIKYRITYPKESIDNPDEFIRDFIESLKWNDFPRIKL